MTEALRIPTLESQRLRLRAHCLSDFSASFSMWSDPAVTRFIGGKPSTEQQAWMRLMSYLGHWSLMNFGYWLVEEMASGAFVGEIGFADFKRDMQPSLQGTAELGWALSPAMQGKGYATEALRCALAWGQAKLPSKEVNCIIHPDNEASLRVAAKCGFKEELRTTYANEATILFRLWL